jgi:hypothetical protein
LRLNDVFLNFAAWQYLASIVTGYLFQNAGDILDHGSLSVFKHRDNSPITGGDILEDIIDTSIRRSIIYKGKIVRA